VQVQKKKEEKEPEPELDANVGQVAKGKEQRSTDGSEIAP